jgi:hypothetical protein
MSLRPILVTVKEAGDLLGLPTHTVYGLAREGGPLERRYVGKGTRNFRLTYDSVEAYAANLPTEALEQSA